jgi:WD40 repeat protein
MSRFGHCFSFDTLSSIGEIGGHSKIINCVSMRQQRPYRVATGSDDQSINFYHGLPFKFNKSMSDHSRFVQCVKFSPDGNLFVSSGMDKKVIIFFCS